MQVRAAVTGSAGFIGSHVVRALEDAGYDVTGIDRGNGGVEAFTRRHDRYDLVVHAAAFLGGREAIEQKMAHAVNLETDAAMFRWAERARPGRLVYFSSVAAYPVRLQRWRGVRLREEDISFTWPHQPDELYGWAKLTGELLATQSSVPVTAVRPFTVYGPGQQDKYPFANILGQVLRKQNPVTVWGSGRQQRDWIHVTDVARAVAACAAAGVDGPVNLCTGKATAIGGLAVAMAREHGYEAELALLPEKPEGLPYRVGDPRRLEEICPPQITLAEGIALAVREWVP
jgi:nucleoside-diphosphate-sugar epimerase